MIKVKYVGPKASQSWPVDGKNVLWERYGAVLEVPDAFEGTINAHPGNWEIVGHAAEPEPDEIPQERVEEISLDPPLVDLSTMDKAQLQTYCQREFGEQVDKRWSEDRVRQYITTKIGSRIHRVN